MRDRPDDDRWRAAGDRIEKLLTASSIGGPAARERAEQLVGEVTDLYGAALERVLEIAAHTAPALSDALVSDDLVASLLLVHGLHPHPVERRITHALDTVRPYLGSHGGDVHLIDVVDRPDGAVVRLRFAGSCKSCPSSAVTLDLAVEDAVRAAAPEIAAIEIVTDPVESDVIPAESLMHRLRSDRGARWLSAPILADLEPGDIGGFRVAAASVVACRSDDELYVYRDRCGHCTSSLSGATLSDRVLTCPCCGTAFDVMHAGTAMSGDDHLDPVPVLIRDGVPTLALADGIV